MGSNVELSNLYLKLFKLVFGSVSLFAAENEQMLKVKVICVKTKKICFDSIHSSGVWRNLFYAV